MAEPKKLRLSSETSSESAPLKIDDTGLIQQLSAKEEECREKDKVIRTQQAEIQRLRDQLAVSQQVN